MIHNAKFDMPFLNAELGWCKLPPIPMDRAIDTLDIARKKFPGSPASLDALCRRFGIDNSHRTLHGALLDSEILAEVYLELIGGRQPGLVLSQRIGRQPRADRARRLAAAAAARAAAAAAHRGGSRRPCRPCRRAGRRRALEKLRGSVSRMARRRLLRWRASSWR